MTQRHIPEDLNPQPESTSTDKAKGCFGGTVNQFSYSWNNLWWQPYETRICNIDKSGLSTV